MELLLFYLFSALTLSFLCSIAEAVLLSSPLSYLKTKEENSKKGIKLLIKQKKDIDKSLSAILSLNTIAHTIGAAGVGAQSIVLFGEVYFGIVSVVLTFLILVLTEIIPKTIGARYWKDLSSVTGYLIQVMLVLMYPIVIFSRTITRKLNKKQDEQIISREEIYQLAKLGFEEGIFEERENKILQNLFRLKTIKVSDIMTPRVVVVAAEENMKLKEFYKNKEFLKFSRIPVYVNNIEEISGYVFRQNVFEKIAENYDYLKLKEVKRKIIFVPNTMSVLNLWKLLLEKKEYIAAVVDEYGVFDGIVTMEDVVETMLGIEIIDEKDTITDMQQYARERWKMRQEKYRNLEN